MASRILSAPLLATSLLCISAVAAPPASPKGAPSGPAAAFALYYTDAHNNDPPRQSLKCGGEGTMPYWLQRATFDAQGALVSPGADLTTEVCGAGYVSLSPDRSTLIFASMDLDTPGNIGNVETYAVDVSGAPAAPRLLISNFSALLNACTGDVCRTASTFHGIYSTDGAQIFFAYRVWDGDDTGVGNQALAVANADGSGVRPLSFTEAGSYKGINIIDMCPTPVANDSSRVFFLRSLDQGMSAFAAIASTATGKVDMLLTLPQYAISSGCPSFVETPTGVTVIYMACDSSVANCSFAERSAAPVRAEKADARAAWGMAAPGAPRGAGYESWYYYGSIELKTGLAPDSIKWTQTFNVALTDTPYTKGSYAITQCGGIQGAPGGRTLSCEGASPTHFTYSIPLVDFATGANVSAPSYNTFRACMTPRCSMMATA
jgi:hypothetical protein